MTTKQLSIFLENKPGALAAVCKVLQEGNVSMRAMSLAEAEDFGLLRIIVDDAYSAMTYLRENDYVCRLTKVLTVEIDDKPGALLETLNTLAEAGVNLEYSYAFLGKQPDKAYMVLRVTDPEHAIEKLSGKGIKLICQDDLHELFED